MPNIIVGCPVTNRNWILPLWKNHVEHSVPLDWNLKYIFVVPKGDKDTLDLLSEWRDTWVILSDEENRKDVRNWGNKDRYYEMADLRNTLLRAVRQEKPDIFLSLDSDILLDKYTVANMYETMLANDCDAVGGLTYLDPTDKNCTNIANWKNSNTCNGFTRMVTQGCHKVDIIMAIQMMNNLAYNVNYEYHDMGEDLGWCKALKKTRAKIFCDARTANKHVMSKPDLDKVDKRVGF